MEKPAPPAPPLKVKHNTIAQLVLRAKLASDGSYQSSPTINRGINGLSSESVVRAWTADTTVPSAPIVTLTE
jgi:hypothetical protein